MRSICLFIALLSTACDIPEAPDMPVLRLGRRPNERRVFIPTTAGSEVEDVGEPPDEFEVAVGQWGLDIENSYAVFRTGESSIWFKDTIAHPELQHDADHQVPVDAGRSYEAWAIFQADFNNPAFSDVFCYVDWMQEDKVTRISSSEVYDAPVDTVGEWQLAKTIVTAPDGAYFARMRFGRRHTLNAYFDEVGMQEAVTLWNGVHAAGQSIPNATFTTVEFDTVTAVDATYDGAGVITIDVAGYYFIQSSVSISSLALGNAAYLRLWINGADEYFLDRQVLASGYSPLVRGSLLKYFEVGETIEVQVYHNFGAARNLMTAGDAARFDGIKIM